MAIRESAREKKEGRGDGSRNIPFLICSGDGFLGSGSLNLKTARMSRPRVKISTALFLISISLLLFILVF